VTPSRPAPSRSPTLATTPPGSIERALRGNGLRIDYGAVALRLRSDSAHLAAQLRAVYADFAFDESTGWADLHVEVMRQRGLRRWFAPQVVFRCDGRAPFVPFPADSPLPLTEWGVNWLIGQRLNDLLLLHAGAVERDGLALILPAVPGSGKSTLTAALSLRGWRLLSDEFGAYDPALGAFRALLKPVALKNQSIDVIRAFEPRARLGPSFPKTRKGTVAHLGADASAVARRAETAAPGAVILPKWSAGASTRLEPVAPDRLFPALAYNAFNYTTLGSLGFDAAVHLTRACPGWTLVYSDLDDALAAIDELWAGVVVARADARREAAA
jgi:HprK-related kinase A